MHENYNQPNVAWRFEIGLDVYDLHEANLK